MNQAFSDGSPTPAAQIRSAALALCHANDVVARALAPLDQDQRTRVLLSAAVLFGIIKPGEPEPPRIVVQRAPKAEVRRRTPGDSIRARVERELAERGEASTWDLAAATGDDKESVAAALSKLVADGKATRIRMGLYAYMAPEQRR